MPTTVANLIGTGETYTTLQSWEDAAPANLVTADQIWEGQLKNQTFSVSSGPTVTFAGSTTDATRYKHLTCAAAASFIDNIGSGALRYNTANGAALTRTGGYSTVITCTESYAHLSRLQIAASGSIVGVNAVSATGTSITNCIVETNGAGTVDSAAYLANCLFVQRGGGSARCVLASFALSAYNCTIVAPSDKTSSQPAFVFGYAATRVIQNCAFFGFASVRNNSSGTFTTCYTDVASPPSGCTTVAYDTTTGSGFEGITDSARDFRLKSTSALKDTGTTDSTNAATDIVGTTRPQGSAYDVGCHEVSAGGGATANGETVTATATLVDGTAYAVQSPTAVGQTLSATASLVDGVASAGTSATASGQILTAICSLVDGVASAVQSPTALGAILTAVCSLIPGIAYVPGIASRLPPTKLRMNLTLGLR